MGNRRDRLFLADLKIDDRDALMEMVMEVSGTRMVVDKTFSGLDGLATWQDIAMSLIDADKRMNSTLTKLFSSFTNRQHDDMHSKGFSFAEPQQLEELYFNEDCTLFFEPISMRLFSIRLFSSILSRKMAERCVVERI